MKPDSGTALDTSNPLTTNLVAAYVVNENGGTVLTDATGTTGNATAQGTLDTVAGWQTIADPDRFQFVMDSNVNNYWSVPSAIITSFTSAMSMVVRFRVQSTASQIVASINVSSSSNQQYGIGTNGSGNYVLQARNTVFQSATSSSTATLNDVVTLVGTAPDNTERTLYVNAGAGTTNSTSIGSGGTLNTTDIGRFGDSSPGAAFDGGLILAYFYDRELSSAEAASIANNPYQIFQTGGSAPGNILPRRRRRD